MITVRWDNNLAPVKSPEEEEIARWDEWFTAAGIVEEWEKVKAACQQVKATHSEIIRWAQILELTRLSSL